MPPPELHGGGTIANTAVGIARLGVPVRFAGAVGDEGYGRFVAEDLQREGVDTGLLRHTDRDFTVSVFAIVHPGGERTITVWPPEGGAHSYLEAEDLPAAQVRSAGWLHCSGIALRRRPVRETIIAAAQTAAEAGIPVSLDLNLRLEFWGWDHEVFETIERLLPSVTTVFGSLEDEIRPFLARRTARAATVDQAPATGGQRPIRETLASLAAGRRTVIARRGAAGAAILGRDGSFREAPARPVTVVDSVGAGDAFNAGYISGIMRGEPETRALDWGLCASAHQIAREGARALPTRRELESCLAEGN